jgi:hypothetical protein
MLDVCAAIFSRDIHPALALAQRLVPRLSMPSPTTQGDGAKRAAPLSDLKQTSQ